VLRLLTKYGGPDAVRRDGDGMYYLYPQARESWYPAGNEGMGGFGDFNMTFHLPKNLQIVATGKQISHESEAGGVQRVVWASQFPIPVAGFNLGDFKSADEKTPQGFDVQAYANTELPDSIKPYVEMLSLGTMTTTAALKNEVSQGSAAIQVYSDYFGKLPYDHLALTEQSACNFGQSWPMLVYLPICSFWDSTIQQRLGMRDFGEASYWKEVTPHEVSHQWWGQEVGFSSYRDQWMSEGFANFSVSLYLAATNKNLDEFHDFWNEQHKNLVEKNRFGVRPIDVGPLTMGERVSNEKTGNVYQSLIYSKGAYVMHMLQIMYWTPQQGDGPFKHSMQTFVQEYAGKAASTEDLKASFERTMPRWVDLRHNGKLDWFFNEYVYGTELPHYEISSEFTTADGETTVHFKVTQSNVSKDFLMLVPLYLQMADGRTVRILNLGMEGDRVSDHTVKLGKLPAPAKKLLLNYNQDVLSD
jgi:aminopeptidase N